MSLPVRTTPEADAQILAVDDWWRRNRPASPNLFAEELAASFEVVGHTPNIGRLYRPSPVPETRRVLLKGTRYLRQEQTCLDQAERTVGEVRRWRDLEAYRFWPDVVYRWALALAFALAAVWTAGAGYARVTRPHAAEIAVLRSRAEFIDLVERRVATMTASERRQFDALMKGRPRTSADAAVANYRHVWGRPHLPASELTRTRG